MRRKLRRKEQKKNKKMLLLSILLLILLTVGYGSFQTTININVTGKLKKQIFMYHQVETT